MLFIDIETYSSTDLRGANVYSYSEDPAFQIIMAAYAVDDGPVRTVTDAADIYAIPGLWDPTVLKVAHNAQFERVCFSRFGGLPVDEFLPPEQWLDTMAIASLGGLPRKLEHLAVALGAEDKDTAGTRLINVFCKPKRDGGRNLPEDRPDDWAAFLRYCEQDVATLRDVYRKLPGWPTAAEREVFHTDQRINDRGIAVDTAMARAAVAQAADNHMEQELEISVLTGITNPNSHQQMLGWLQDSGTPIRDLKADTITRVLARDDLTDDQRAVLQIRQDLALTAPKKYQAALDRVSRDDRLRGAFAYHGAHTGRWAGRGVQLQNLPSASLQDDSAVESAISDLKAGRGADSYTLKALVRPMFTGPLTVVDYSAIEARVVAWLAGEVWAMDAFRAGRDIYVETAERMGGLSRKEGKVAVLALGYQGGVGSLSAMGAEGGRDHLQFLVDQWRRANGEIAQFWHLMDEAFRRGDQDVGEHIRVVRDGRDRHLVLPSGRSLLYRDLRGRWKTTPWGTDVKQVSFSDPKAPGLRTDTYGGRLTENVTQAVARDILAEALVRLDSRGYPVVGHVHDEILVAGDYPVEQVEQVMTVPPEWSAGLPIAAEGFRAARYRKD